MMMMTMLAEKLEPTLQERLRLFCKHFIACWQQSLAIMAIYNDNDQTNYDYSQANYDNDQANYDNDDTNNDYDHWSGRL